jgi:hypothetical protein
MRIVLEEFADRKKDLKTMHDNKQLSDAQIKDALAYVWVGKRFKQLANVVHMSEKEKREYIQHILDKKAIDEANGVDDDDIIGADGKPIKRDKPKTEAILGRLASEDRAAITKFEREVKDAEKVRKDEQRRAAKAAAAAATSRPASHPAGAKPDASTPVKPK